MNTYQLAIEYFGKDHQLIKAIEELNELSKELCKVALNDSSKERLEKVAEEIADAEIMIQQLKYILPISAIIPKYKMLKLNRIREKILEENIVC